MMEDIFYKSIVDESPTGYALHKIECDENGTPVDYTFLDVNEAFSKATGIYKKDIVGKKMTQINPNVREDEHDWVKEYGEVALLGVKKEFEGYSKTFNQHYKIKAFSPEKGYFVTLFTDIRKEIDLEKEMLELYESGPYEIYEFDDTGKILRVNDKAGNNTGYSKDELVGGMFVMDFLVSKESEQRFFAALSSIEQGREINLEYPYKKRSGEIRYARATIVKRDQKNFISYANDITEHFITRQKEETVKQQYQILFENLSSGCGVYTVKKQGKFGKDYIIEDFNKKSLEIEKKTKEEVVGKSLYDLRPNIDEYGLIDIFREVWQTGVPKIFPSKIYIDEKYQSYYENHVFKLDDNKIVALYNDVTEAMQMQEQLEDSRAKLEKYIEMAPYGIFVIDQQGKLIDTNLEGLKMTGYSKEELLELTIFDNIPEGSFEQLVDFFKIISEEMKLDFEQKYTIKDGRTREWDIRAIKMKDGTILAFTKDITEEKEAQNKLTEAQEEFKALFNRAGAGIGYYTTDGRVIWLNELAAKRIGGKPEDFEGKTVFDLFPPEDAKKFTDRLRQAVQSNAIGLYEDFIEMSAEPMWLNSTYNCIHNSEGQLLGVEVISQDITAMKKSEKALRESEARFRSMVESSSAIMLLIDPRNAKIDHANPAACKFYGWTLEEMLKKTIYDINIASNVEIKRCMNQIVDNKSGKLKFKHMLRSGEVRDVNVDSTLIDISGKKQLFSIITDDTERVMAEQRLKESESFYRLLYEDAPLGYQSLDEKGYYIEVNSAWLKMTGYEKEEVIGKNFGDFIEPNDVSKYEDNYPKYKAEGNTSITIRMRKKSGDVITVDLNGRVSYNKDGSFKQSHCILSDITKKLEYEETILRNAQRLKRSQEIVNAGSWEIENGSNVIWASDQGFEIYGLKKTTNMVGVEVIENMIHENDRRMAHEALINLFKNGDKYDVVFRIRPKNSKHIKYVHSVAELEKDSEGNVIRCVGVVIDITEQILLEKERDKAEAMLRNQQKLESIGTLASGVAHEINNPINGILNYGQVIADMVPEDSEIKGFANEIINETNRVAKIVSNLLDFSRHSNRQHSYARIEDIVDKTLSLTKTIFRHDNISLNVSIAKNISSIKCRSQQIQQVLMNLLTNARDALNEKYPSTDDNKIINLKCRQFKRRDRNWISIIVEDFGGGISDDLKPRIFDPFFTTKKQNKGTGLGLSISYGIIKEHHGDIHFETKQGQSTRFIIHLPCDNGWDIEDNN